VVLLKSRRHERSDASIIHENVAEVKKTHPCIGAIFACSFIISLAKDVSQQEQCTMVKTSSLGLGDTGK
jgi:hypothetical protein